MERSTAYYNGGWIPIGQYPTESCLLCTESGDMVVGKYDLDDDTWVVNTMDGYTTDVDIEEMDGEPVAWQPLPKPYKTE